MNSKKNLKRNLLICLLAGSAVMYTLPLHAATSVIGNGTLPSGGQFFDGNKFTQGTVIENGHNFEGIGSITKPNDLTMNVHQNNQNAVIKWDSFNVGGSATVNFKGPQVEGGYNTLNYVNAGGSMSQIYGTINANNNGNIFIVNPAGVQIGNSAQINVGSLYVSSNTLSDTELSNFYDKAGNTGFTLDGTRNADIELMSLGNINAGKVTFEGDGRIVIDSERIKDEAGNDKLDYQNINITTSADNTDNIIIGYDAYDETNGYKIADPGTAIATVNGSDFITKADGYMWVEDVEQLQAINTNLSGNYALRNSIDATSTEQQGNEFSSIGITSDGYVDNDGEGFTGKFDGLDYSIFDLNIDETGNDNVGLFGYTTDATISNVTLVGGSIRGNNNVGAVVGNANNTTVTNALNSAAVSGNSNVGGIVGSATNTTVEDAINTGAIEGRENTNGGSNVGGLIGSMDNSHLIGNSYNLGDVTSIGSNVGGLVGSASNSTIGDGTNLVYNRLDVTGRYNVGGIVGNMEGTIVQNAENSGTVEATGYTTEGYTYHTGVRNSGSLPSGTLNVDDGTVTTTVNIANAGGIAGTSSDSEIVKVTNTADVSTATETGTQYTVDDLTYYTAGNVGGIVGRAEDTNISDATNQENEIRGAHNVGGVAGYFGGTGTVSGGINDGGDIMATGARYNDNFVRELIRPVGDSNESFIIGNIGGVVGYMDGDNVYVTESANRGTVHSQDIEEENATNVLYTSQAANVGGVVGKIDRSSTESLDDIKDGTEQAAVSDSYNTGDVRGYTGVGGVVGMMYNGEVASSYNLGYIRTTRIATDSINIEAVNMGGIVGDTTEGSRSEGVVIYDVYNKGQIGDDTYTYYARHVGGIVGRLSGAVEKAYNNGEIYNGYTATGGIAGWMYEGSINNSFNTGNITVYNHDSSTSQVGGIVGAASVGSGNIELSNIYNLGTLRSFQANQNYTGSGISHGVGKNAIGGIIGGVMGNSNALNINGAYTTGNIYAGVQDNNGNISLDTGNDMVGSIYGENRNTATINRTNTYYIRPESGIGFTQLGTSDYGMNNSNKGIDYEDRFDSNEYSYTIGNTEYRLGFSSQSGGDVTDNTDSNWRLYKDGTPILNAFLPDSESYFDQYGNEDTLADAGMDSVQYGTAYDPLLTIITANDNAKGNLSFTLGTGNNELSISNAAGLVVYNAGLTLNNFSSSTSSSGYYGGLIYSDGVLTINAANNEGLAFGSGADIYGSSVTLDADGTVTIYGDVVATGNDTQVGNDPDKAGSINITSNNGDVNVYGTLTSVTERKSVTIPGISAAPDSNWRPVDTSDSISDPSDSLNTIGERYEHTTTASAVNGNITITANGVKDEEGNLVSGGNVGLYYGNKGEGITTTGGNLSVIGTGDVYVDSDLDIGGDLMLEGTGADSEVVLDITNIGQVQADNGTVGNALTGLHNFLNHFADADNSIELDSESGDAKLAVDMWDETANNNQGAYNLDKFNNGNDSFADKLDGLNLTVNGTTIENDASAYTYIWVNDADQLNGIQNYYDTHAGANILNYNFALKNDINASDLTDFNVIGTNADDVVIGYSGTFDGRGNRIIGLEVDNEINAGIFSKINQTGTVKNLNVYSGTFTGTDTAGAVAGINNGTIENITAFGNTVTVTGNDGNAGGIAGTNSGIVDDVESSGSVIGEGDNAIVGGLVGTNEKVNNESKATISNSYSNSAVTSTSGTNAGLGGVVGVNEGTVSLVDSLGVTNGTNSTNVGGVIGINNGTLSSAYNESIVNGNSNVGGIIGTNGTYTVNDDTITWTSRGTVSNIVNATSVTGGDETADNVSEYVGGLVGINGGSIENGRNNGTITGTKYVGGMVGSNAQGATLTNLVNDSSAAIEGEQYVGGIAGSNAGSISATDNGLINRGSITGNKFVGGVAGVNEEGGTIENTISNIELNVKTPYTDDNNTDNDPAFFGGVVGQNSGTVIGARNQSSVDVAADGATFVGGIIGQNTSTGSLQGQILNEGTVSGLSNVGGIIGENENAQLLNNADDNERLKITNTGSVSAIQGGAAGIFYSNNISGTEGDTNANAINNVDITNSGTVTGGTDENSVTGGLFGINSGNITNSTLTNTGVVTGGGTVGGLIGENTGNATGSAFTNEGIVEGNNKVGGLFGTNSGKFETSSLINTVNAQVIGTQNVGGLIGTNTGTITGGRLEADGKTDAGYYKYQIYNNGTITVTGEGQNIGGLIGYNTIANGTPGSLTAGYNTGAIKAENSSNVGGIVGNNAGTVDQVFNTVMTGVDDKGNTVYGTITGKDNVGGLIGTNSGTLSNAYNTTEVKPTNSGVVGNAVGENSGTITNIYASNTSGNLIGTGYDNGKVTNAYSFSDDDNGTNNITVITEDGRQNSDSYNGFDFDSTGATKDGETAASDGTEDYWKIYTGSGNPLLKVFLTTVTVDADNLPNLVYNTKDQDLIIGSLIGENGAFSADDDFKAYQNNNSLIQNTDFEHKNAGTYDNWLYSGQIASGSQEEGTFNPNNLGYDIEFKADIDKAQITVDLNQVDRVYGNTDIINGEYGFSYGFNNVLSDADKTALIDELNKNSVLNMNDVNAATDDKALVENGNKTNDAGSYDWTGTVNIAKNYQGNYEFVVKDTGTIDNGGATITTTGDSIVNKRQLSVSDIIANIVYGNQDGKGFIVSGGELIGVNGNAGIVYDDKVKLDTSLKVEDANIIANSSYASNKGNRVTADAGTYENSLNFSGLGLSGDDANNYVLVNDSFGGTIEVTQATINVDLNDVDRIYGSTAFNGNGYAVSDVQHNANGDSYNANDFVVSVNVGNDGALTGNDTGKVTNDVGAYSYIGTVISNNEKLNQNYKIVVNNSEANNNIGSGVSTVSKADLSVTINNVDTVYGTAFDESKYGYTLDNLVNGDGNSSDIVNVIENAINNASGGYNNTGAADGTNGKVTQDAEGDYSLSFKNDITKEEILKNYNITTVTNGDANVSKKQISIGANDEEIHVGEVPVYTGTDINGVLVNGDKLSGDYHYGVADNAIESVVGKHNGVIGVWLNGTFYDLSLNTDWSKVSGLEFFSNYAVDYKPGTLTVTEQVMPDLPDNWPGNRWDYLFNDAPFDRNKNFRERKAEVNFVDGGMEV